MNPSTEPKVCIVVLNWQSAEHSLECLRSLEKLHYGHYEIVIVENGSQDDSEAVLKQAFPQHAFIQTGKNLGYAGGNNKGISYAIENKAEYILILNNDTTVDCDLLKVFVGTAHRNPEAGIFSPKIYDSFNREKLLYAGTQWDEVRSKFVIEGQGSPDNDQLHEIAYAAGSALFFRSELIQKVGQFDERFFLTWEETDWCYRAKRAGYKILLEPSAKVWHKTSSSFKGGQAGAQYRYYLTRNQFLWIEKNLRGLDRLRAYKRAFKEALTTADPKVAKAKRAAFFHYLFRRFHQGPSWL